MSYSSPSLFRFGAESPFQCSEAVTCSVPHSIVNMSLANWMRKSSLRRKENRATCKASPLLRLKNFSLTERREYQIDRCVLLNASNPRCKWKSIKQTETAWQMYVVQSFNGKVWQYYVLKCENVQCGTHRRFNTVGRLLLQDVKFPLKMELSKILGTYTQIVRRYQKVSKEN
jgi:hypothetical protein